MRISKNILFTIIACFIIHTSVFAFRVYPTTAQNELMFNKANFLFIAENADGFNLQYDSFGPFSNSQVETIFNQFTNKNFINHGVYNGGSIANISTMGKKPSFANVTAFMLYSEAPAMDAADWTSALSQNVTWPLITHCRAYGTASNYDEVRSQILRTSGIMMEFQVTDPGKYEDAAALVKYCVDNNKMVVFLTTFQRTPEIFISAYKEFYYYLKENLAASYLNSDKVIFVPNTYHDTQVFPETKGYGSTFGVAHWLIDQKSKTNDGYIQPKISFANVGDSDYFPNHSNLTVNLNVTSSLAVSNVKLYVDNVLVGDDSTAPYSWSGGALNNLTTGYKQLIAVVTDASGVETSKAVQIRVLGDPIELPGAFVASEINAYNLRNIPDYYGFIRHVYGNEWIDYQVDVKHAGLYDVSVDVKIQRSKQYGGTIILMSGTRELGRFTTVLNDPANAPLAGFTETPAIEIKNVQLSAGVQKIRVKFVHPTGQIKPQFYLFGFKFKKQGAAAISFATPEKNATDGYNSYDSPAQVKIAANVVSPRTGGSVGEVSLYMSKAELDTDNILPELIPDIRPQLNYVLMKKIIQAPYVWNDATNIAAMNALPAGNYMFKVVATDELGYKSFEEINLSVVDRVPFNTSLKIPGIVKAWEYDLGGEGVGYHEFNAGNVRLERGLDGEQNPRYAKAGQEDVEVEASGSDYIVSAVRNGEWLNYTVSDVQKGVYDIIFNSASNTGKSANVKVWLNNKLIATIPIVETGSSFTVFRDFKVSGITIPQNMEKTTIRLEFDNPSITTHLCYFRKFEFKKTAELTALSDVDSDKLLLIYPNPAKSFCRIQVNHLSPYSLNISDISGKEVFSTPTLTQEAYILDSKNYAKGIYIVQVNSNEFGSISKKMILQ